MLNIVREFPLVWLAMLRAMNPPKYIYSLDQQGALLAHAEPAAISTPGLRSLSCSPATHLHVYPSRALLCTSCRIQHFPSQNIMLLMVGCPVLGSNVSALGSSSLQRASSTFHFSILSRFAVATPTPQICKTFSKFSRGPSLWSEPCQVLQTMNTVLMQLFSYTSGDYRSHSLSHDSMSLQLTGPATQELSLIL